MTAFSFRSHIRGEPAEYPGLFMVPANSIVGPEDPIVQPAESTNLHYEAEMVVVVGMRADNVSVEDAPEYIFGGPQERCQREELARRRHSVDAFSYISGYFVLEPGDLIWSGTMGSTRAMELGDVYEVEVSGVGTLRNEVVQGK